MTKRPTVNRENATIRIPADLFKQIDKRKRKIPLIIDYTEHACIIKVDFDKLRRKGE